jgi:2-polyprenyl-6-methoxyphenol hydroxylase-like FAD-dependent oxidoreductase
LTTVAQLRQALAAALDAAARAGADLGDPSASGHLAAYASERKAAALTLMASLDTLHRLFGDQPPAAAAAAQQQAGSSRESAGAGTAGLGAAPGAAEASATSGGSAAGFGALGIYADVSSSNSSSSGSSSSSGPVSAASLPWPLRRAVSDLREAGLATLNLLPPLKALLAKHAMGLK